MNYRPSSTYLSMREFFHVVCHYFHFKPSHMHTAQRLNKSHATGKWANNFPPQNASNGPHKVSSTKSSSSMSNSRKNSRKRRKLSGMKRIAATTRERSRIEHLNCAFITVGLFEFHLVFQARWHDQDLKTVPIASACHIDPPEECLEECNDCQIQIKGFRVWQSHDISSFNRCQLLRDKLEIEFSIDCFIWLPKCKYSILHLYLKSNIEFGTAILIWSWIFDHRTKYTNQILSIPLLDKANWFDCSI